MTATPEDVLAGRARWCVMQGDCLQVLPTLPEKSVGVVLTDHPYSEATHRGLGREGRDDGFSVREALDFEPLVDIGGLADQIGRVLARWCVTFCDERQLGAWVASALEFIRHGVWVKTNPMPQMSGDRPGVGFESIAILHAPREFGRMRWNGGGRPAVFRSDGNNPRSGGEVPEHPTMKPVPLMVELVELFTDPDEVVLDPFAGSGTTGVACLRLGRRCVLIEKSEKYAALARERMEAEEKGLTLRDARAGQLPLLSLSK